MHRAAMGNINTAQLGIASGLYGMIRFGGMVIGVALVGVLLEAGLRYFDTPLPAYRMAFISIAVVALLGVVATRYLTETHHS